MSLFFVIIKIGDYMKSCLVLEGGALRGIYTAGVIDYLLEKDISFDTVVGVSAGALFGCNYISKQRGRALRYNLKYRHDKNYMGFYSFITTGNIMNEKFCFDDLVNKLDKFDYDTFKNNKTNFYAVVSNLETGKAEYKKITDMTKKDQIEYLRASGSMPIISKIVNINGNKYLDGGMADSIPVDWALKGFDKVVVVSTRAIEYRKKKSPIWPYKLVYRKYPKFIDTVKKRWIDYNNTQDELVKLEKENKIFVIRPSYSTGISRLEKDLNKIQEQYDLGYNDMKKCLKDMKKYLDK